MGKEEGGREEGNGGREGMIRDHRRKKGGLGLIREKDGKVRGNIGNVGKVWEDGELG